MNNFNINSLKNFNDYDSYRIYKEYEDFFKEQEIMEQFDEMRNNSTESNQLNEWLMDKIAGKIVNRVLGDTIERGQKMNDEIQERMQKLKEQCDEIIRKADEKNDTKLGELAQAVKDIIEDANKQQFDTLKLIGKAGTSFSAYQTKVAGVLAVNWDALLMPLESWQMIFLSYELYMAMIKRTLVKYIMMFKIQFSRFEYSLWLAVASTENLEIEKQLSDLRDNIEAVMKKLADDTLLEKDKKTLNTTLKNLREQETALMKRMNDELGRYGYSNDEDIYRGATEKIEQINGQNLDDEVQSIKDQMQTRQNGWGNTPFLSTFANALTQATIQQASKVCNMIGTNFLELCEIFKQSNLADIKKALKQEQKMMMDDERKHQEDLDKEKLESEIAELNAKSAKLYEVIKKHGGLKNKDIESIKNALESFYNPERNDNEKEFLIHSKNGDDDILTKQGNLVAYINNGKTKDGKKIDKLDIAKSNLEFALDDKLFDKYVKYVKNYCLSLGMSKEDILKESITQNKYMSFSEFALFEDNKKQSSYEKNFESSIDALKSAGVIHSDSLSIEEKKYVDARTGKLTQEGRDAIENSSKGGLYKKSYDDLLKDGDIGEIDDKFKKFLYTCCYKFDMLNRRGDINDNGFFNDISSAKNFDATRKDKESAKSIRSFFSTIVRKNKEYNENISKKIYTNND